MVNYGRIRAPPTIFIGQISVAETCKHYGSNFVYHTLFKLIVQYHYRFILFMSYSVVAAHFFKLMVLIIQRMHYHSLAFVKFLRFIYSYFRHIPKETQHFITSSKAVAISGSSSEKPFTFDVVFNEKSSQENVFKAAVRPLIKDILEGYNGTVLSYVRLH